MLFLVKREAGVHFGGDASRYAFKNFRTDIDRQLVAGLGDLLLLRLPALFAIGKGVINQMTKVRKTGRLEQQRGVGGRVFRLVVTNRLDVAAVCNHGGKLFDAV